MIFNFPFKAFISNLLDFSIFLELYHNFLIIDLSLFLNLVILENDALVLEVLPSTP